jgi:ribonuclease Z
MRHGWSIVILALGLTEPLPAETLQAPRTKVVLLGTGTPSPNPDRSGPATAIVVNDTAYLVDLGPGVVRRASAAATSRGITALQPTRLRVSIITTARPSKSCRPI